ncbi:MAG TPA: DUF4188 domain-containing protein [Acidobacteriaceae bacterium]|jgi:hypothetical protein|nr:DUF4188 domain-containing protein [Acidobacteriaceae bacterium]
MPAIHSGRFTAQIEGDFVVFLIGMRVNRLLLVHKWLPVAVAMPPMIKELMRQPELGLLHAQLFFSDRTLLTVQYWRSFEQLHAYAHARDKKHLPAWADFNRKVGNNGSVGVFHETYQVKAGHYECVYVNTPRMGLALAGEMLPAVGRLESAMSRMGRDGPKS